mmetsp:Transcript_13899/g.43090  ORF Transcript_13899/g.43090 Transcript_13899/m.43090 type:complete len:207 (+) Transcript_13899:486-1106(+)
MLPDDVRQVRRGRRWPRRPDPVRPRRFRARRRFCKRQRGIIHGRRRRPHGRRPGGAPVPPRGRSLARLDGRRKRPRRRRTSVGHVHGDAVAERPRRRRRRAHVERVRRGRPVPRARLPRARAERLEALRRGGAARHYLDVCHRKRHGEPAPRRRRAERLRRQRGSRRLLRSPVDERRPRRQSVRVDDRGEGVSRVWRAVAPRAAVV